MTGETTRGITTSTAGLGAPPCAPLDTDQVSARLPARNPETARGASSGRRRTYSPTEAEVLRAVLRVLTLHPKVAFAYRSNSGAVAYGEGARRRYVKFGVRGLPDITGMLRDGRALYVECKREGETPSADQAAFLDRINVSGGVGILARSVDDVISALETA